MWRRWAIGALGLVLALPRGLGSPSPTISRSFSDGYAEPDLVVPVTYWDVLRDGSIAVDATVRLSVTNAPSAALAGGNGSASMLESQAFALVLCPSSVTDGIQLTLPLGPGINSAVSSLCGRDAFLGEGDSRQPSSTQCGFLRLERKEASPMPASARGEQSLTDVSAEFAVSGTFKPAASDTWTLFVSECGLIRLQSAMIEHNAEHEACQRQEALSREPAGNVTVGTKTVDCGMRADPFTWSASGVVGVTPRQPWGEYLPSGEVPRLLLRPGLLAVEVAVVVLLAVRTASVSRGGHSTRLHRVLLALLVVRVGLSMLQLAALRAMAEGATYVQRARAFFPLMRVSNGVATGIVVIVALLTVSGWQTLFASLPPTGVTFGIGVTAMAVTGAVTPASVMLPEAPPLPSNLVPIRPQPADGPSPADRGQREGDVEPWIAAAAIAGAASVIVAAFTLRYVATMAVATASFRLSTVRAGRPGPAQQRAVAILSVQEDMLKGARRDLLALQLAWLIIFAVSGPVSSSSTLSWVTDLVQEGAALAFLAATAYRFRPRQRGPGATQVAPAAVAGAREEDRAGPVPEAEAAAEARRFLLVDGLDGPEGPSELVAAPLAAIVERIAGRDEPPVTRRPGVYHGLGERKWRAPPLVLLRLPRAGDGAEPAGGHDDVAPDGGGAANEGPGAPAAAPEPPRADAAGAADEVMLGCQPSALPWLHQRGVGRDAPSRGRTGHRLVRLARAQVT